MAYAFNNHQQDISIPSTLPPPINNNNVNHIDHIRSSNNFDAPLIGNLNMDNNANDNNNAMMSNAIMYGHDTHNDDDNNALNTNEFFDDHHTFGIGMDSNMNIYGSPSLSFDHHTLIPTMTTPLPTINDDIVVDDIDNFDDPMFDTIKYAFSSRSDFIDQTEINTVTDGISSFLTPSPMNFNMHNRNHSHEPRTLFPPQTPTPTHPQTQQQPQPPTTKVTNPFGTPSAFKNLQTTTPNTAKSSSSNNSNSTASSSLTTTSPSSNTLNTSSSSASTSNSSLISSNNSEMEIDKDMTPLTAQPPKYEQIKHNIFVSRKKRKRTASKNKNAYQYKCDCHYTANGDNCDANACFNKLFYYECTDANSCSVEDETGDPLKCKNRKFQRGEWKNVIVGSAGKKGWGLYANEDIECGDFIIEYVGEIISAQECNDRLKNKYRSNVKFYILKLEGGKKGECIDATTKGCPARFMNHSCSPNCKAQKWTVGGEVCLGFFADRNIKKGEELCFDYNFQRYGAIKQKCFCGAPNCRKYLGVKDSVKTPMSKSMNVNSKSKKDEKKTKYKKNPKIMTRNMDDRILVKECFDYLHKLSDIRTCDHQQNVDEDVMNKCMAKGRLLRRTYIDCLTQNSLLSKVRNGEVSFEQIIRNGEPYKHKKKNCKVLKEPFDGDMLMNISAMNEFENIITKQYELGSDYECKHLMKMKNVNETLRSHKIECNEIYKCSLCLLYGMNSCQYAICSNFNDRNHLRVHHHHHHMHGMNEGNVDEVVKKKYLKLKKVSEAQVLESKIKNQNQTKQHIKSSKHVKSKKHKKKSPKKEKPIMSVMDIDIHSDALNKDQSDADSQYAAHLHEELNKRHLRSRRSTRHAMKRSISAPNVINDHVNGTNDDDHMNEIKRQKHSNVPLQIHDALIPKQHKIRKHVKIKQKMNENKPNSPRGKVKKKEKINIDGEDVNDIAYCSKCGISKDSLKTKGTWSRHLHSKHTYYCKQCSFQFTTAATLADHERSAHSINNQQQNMKKVKKHKSKIDKNNDNKQKQNDEPPDYCPKCGRFRGETAKSHWNKHIQTDHKYPCPQCKYKFAHRKKYNEHIKQCHGNDQMSQNSVTTNSVSTIATNDNEQKEEVTVEKKKRKYSNYASEQQPRKRRKITEKNDDNLFKDNETIKALMQQRDEELRLFEFAQFAGYGEDEELMISVYNKMDKNDEKYKKVFEKEEKMNQEIIDTLNSLRGKDSVFNSLIFPSTNNHKKVQKKKKKNQQKAQIQSIQSMQTMQVPPIPNLPILRTTQPPISIPPTQPILIQQSQPLPNVPNIPKITNAHFNASKKSPPKTPIQSNINHRFAQSQYHSASASASTPNSSHTPSSCGTPNSSLSSGTPSSTNSNTPNSKPMAMNTNGNANHLRNNRNNHRIQQYRHHHQPHHHHIKDNNHHHRSHSHSGNSSYRYSYNQSQNAEIDNSDNKTLFIDNIPIKCTEEAIQSALKRHGSIKSFILKTKQNKTSQYANVVCFQKHICESLIDVGRKPIALEVNGEIIQQKLLISYHNQSKVDKARERRLKQQQQQLQHK